MYWGYLCFRFVLVPLPLLETWVSIVFVLQNLTFAASDLIWWRGLARLLEDRGFIRDGDGMV